MQDRREFFQSLIAGGAAISERPDQRNRRERHQDYQLYRGPLSIPENVAEAVAERVHLVRTTHRKLAMRYTDPTTGIVYLLRSPVPAHRSMVGEVIRTRAGAIRVHCWSAANPGEYPTPGATIERHSALRGE